MQSVPGQFKSIHESRVGGPSCTEILETDGPAECRLHPQKCLPFKSACEKIKGDLTTGQGAALLRRRDFSWKRKFGDRQGTVLG